MPSILPSSPGGAKRQDPVIQVSWCRSAANLDCRVKPGNDGRGKTVLSTAWDRNLPHRHFQLADAVDAAVEHVTALHRPDAGRRAGEDEIAGAQLEQAGEIGDHLRHLPDQLVEVALL